MTENHPLGAADSALHAPHALVLVRTLAAPRALVWRMWTEEAHLAKWWGPVGFTYLQGTLDLRVGGRFHYGMRGPDGGMLWGLFQFDDIAPRERIVFRNSFSNARGEVAQADFDPDWPREVTNAVTFEDDGHGTRMTLRAAPVAPTPAQVTLFVDMHRSMQQGYGATFDQLAAHLQHA